MTGGEVARRYAKALVEIAERRGVMDETGAELEAAAAELMRHAELRRVLENPRFPKETRVRVVEGVLAALGASELTRSFIRVVVEKDRLVDLPAIAARYRDLADEKRGRVRATVRTAFDLSASAVERIRARLAEKTGWQVLLEVERDPNLIGGLVCRVGSLLMDGSIRNQLKNLRMKLVAE